MTTPGNDWHCLGRLVDLDAFVGHSGDGAENGGRGILGVVDLAGRIHHGRRPPPVDDIRLQFVEDIDPPCRLVWIPDSPEGRSWFIAYTSSDELVWRPERVGDGAQVPGPLKETAARPRPRH